MSNTLNPVLICNADDITNKLYEIERYPQEKIHDEIDFLVHQFNRGHVKVQGYTMVLTENAVLPTEVTDYVTSLFESSHFLDNTLKDLFEKTASHNVSKEKFDCRSQAICKELQDIGQQLQKKPQIHSISQDLSISAKRYLCNIEKGAEELINYYNLYFLELCRHDSFMPREDIRKHIYFTSGKNRIKYDVNKLSNVVTKVNWFPRVILPLMENIEDHAFNSQNDIYSRSGTDLKKQVAFYDKNMSEDKIMICIEDNGFGMTPQISDNMFTRGNTSRECKEGHGQAMYLVKNFVDENEGILDFETELGKGTRFYLTIPYDRIWKN